MAAKYTNIFKNLPKLGLWVWKYAIWKPCSLWSEKIAHTVTHFKVLQCAEIFAHLQCLQWKWLFYSGFRNNKKNFGDKADLDDFKVLCNCYNIKKYFCIEWHGRISTFL
jgi:hypothetical protein